MGPQHPHHGHPTADDDEHEQRRRHHVERQEELAGRQYSSGFGDSTGTSYAGGGAYGGTSSDFSGAEEHATSMAGESADRGMFSSALSAMSGKGSSLQNEHLDEHDAVNQYQNFFGGGGAGGNSATSGAMGTAAAMSALKMFTGGGGGGGGGSSGSGGGGMMNTVMGMMESGGGGGGGQGAGHGGYSSGGGSGGAMGMIGSLMGGGGSGGSSGGQNQLVGMAMAQAAKLYDQQSAAGNTHPNASKQGAINSAAEQAMKMYMKSEMGGSSGGGLMSLASKFM